MWLCKWPFCQSPVCSQLNPLFLQGPFATFKLPYERTCEWTGLKFSNDGKLILVSTNGGTLRLMDAFKGAVLHSFGVRRKRELSAKMYS